MVKSRSAPVNLKSLRRLYSHHFKGTNLHHMIPISRVPGEDDAATKTNRMMVFPYRERAHDAYHVLLWNLRIDQVWMKLDQIHRSIFETRGEYIKQWWISGCDLESGSLEERANFREDRDERLGQSVQVKHLKNVWFRAFGGEDLSTAENLLRIMMLFMIFGQELLDEESLFDNGNLSEFFEKNRPDGYRLWAFETMFGEGKSVHGIKSKIADVLNKDKFYSP